MRENADDRARVKTSEERTIVNRESHTLALLERALDQTAAIIATIRPEQASLPTPCSAWDVQSLVRHVIAQDLRNFIIGARGENADWQASAEELREDWSQAFSDGTERLLETWRGADLDQLVPLPGGREVPLRTRADQQITELAVHGWDLVQATGQQTELDPALAEHALRWSRPMLRPEFRGPDKAFGPEVPVSEDAPIYDRLAGWFGRDPRWTPEPGSDLQP
jgi:uncharacterized protein (TIGR03086 family)